MKPSLWVQRRDVHTRGRGDLAAALEAILTLAPPAGGRISPPVDSWLQHSPVMLAMSDTDREIISEILAQHYDWRSAKARMCTPRRRGHAWRARHRVARFIELVEAMPRVSIVIERNSLPFRPRGDEDALAHLGITELAGGAGVLLRDVPELCSMYALRSHHGVGGFILREPASWDEETLTVALTLWNPEQALTAYWESASDSRMGEALRSKVLEVSFRQVLRDAQAALALCTST